MKWTSRNSYRPVRTHSSRTHENHYPILIASARGNNAELTPPKNTTSREGTRVQKCFISTCIHDHPRRSTSRAPRPQMGKFLGLPRCWLAGRCASKTFASSGCNAGARVILPAAGGSLGLFAAGGILSGCKGRFCRWYGRRSAWRV